MKPIVWVPGIGGSQLVRTGQEYKTVLGRKVPDNRWFNLHHLTLSNISQWKKELGVDLRNDTASGRVIGLEPRDIDIVPFDEGGLRGVRDVVGDFEMLPMHARHWLNKWYNYQYFGPAIDAIHRKNPRWPMIGLPYDVRLVLDPSTRESMFHRWRHEVEAICEATGEEAVVVAHSLGGLIFKWFVSAYVPPEWVEKYIGRFVSLSAPFGGSPVALKVLCAGDHYVPLLKGIFREEMQTCSGIVMCMPNPYGFDVHEPLLTLDNGFNVSIDKMPVLAEVGHPSFAIWTDLWCPHLPALGRDLPMQTDVLIGMGHSTPVQFHGKRLEEITRITRNTDGDGIIPIHSLLACEHMFDRHRLRDVRIRGASHTEMVAHPEMIAHVLGCAKKRG